MDAYYEKKTGTKKPTLASTFKISSSTITSTRTSPKIIPTRKKGHYYYGRAPGFFNRYKRYFSDYLNYRWSDENHERNMVKDEKCLDLCRQELFKPFDYKTTTKIPKIIDESFFFIDHK